MTSLSTTATNTTNISLKHRWGAVSLIIVVFAILVMWREIAQFFGMPPNLRGDAWWIMQWVRAITSFGLILATVMILGRTGPLGALSRLGLGLPRPLAALTPVLAVVPLYLVFALAFGFHDDYRPLDIFRLVIFFPILEDLVFRGFAFGELRRAGGFNFWIAALTPALITGTLHLYQADGWGEIVGTFVIAGGGGIFFSWLYERWGFNLWIPIVMHALMNLAWNLFVVGGGSFAGLLPTVMQITTLILAVGLTLWFQRKRKQTCPAF